MIKPGSHLTTGDDDPFLPKLIEAINSATHIDIAVAFIRSTGLNLLRDALKDALNYKPTVSLRILTGDYLEITEPSALSDLMLLHEQGAKIKIFETQGKQSFHMKAYIFIHDANEEFSKAFVGSSNISRSALNDGLEWNLQVSKEENIERFNEITKKFDTLYRHQQAKPLTHEWIDFYKKRYDAKKAIIEHQFGFDKELELPPEPNFIQEEALYELQKTREEGFIRGLVVLATGIGKTWLAAFDSKSLNAKRVLFVAHREEILLQAEETFLKIQPEAKVGRYTGSQRELNADFLFASIQTLGKVAHLNQFSKDYFDYIVVDEFHHAAAPTYRKLLSHFKPRFLLGLTATPDRTDQSDILVLCDNNLVYCKELVEGINSKILSPFSYFGIGDDKVDYSEIPWRNGKFDADALLHQLATQARAKHIFKHWHELRQTRTLAFCVSKKHADFMAEYFNRRGISSLSVHSDSSIRRNDAITKLIAREVHIIFSVDLFNEGVDIPSIDTVLMLRPTESKIIFLQQLGRGLRHSNETGKQKLIVIDFIGNHISFFKKPEALFKVGITNDKRREFIEQLKSKDLELPEGCFVNYDPKAIDFMERLTSTKIDTQESIYQSLKENFGRRPSMSEFYSAGGNVDIVRNEYGQWLSFTAKQNDLTKYEEQCLDKYGKFFLEVETTKLTKSFKLILLEALIEAEGFIKPISTGELADTSFSVLQRKRMLLIDLPTEYQNIKKLDEKLLPWHKYWLRNPINAWVGGNRKTEQAFFTIENGTFRFKQEISQDIHEHFIALVDELVSYRHLQYEARMINREATPENNIIPFLENDGQEIPYFSDLRIACGHFKASEHGAENIEYKSLSRKYGKLDPAFHFIARANGNSMDGGKNPIKHGDYLLLERITSNNAGSNNGKIIAIEQQGDSGDDHYLLRRIEKIRDGEYQLIAQNLEYSPMIADDGMKPFARLRDVIDVDDILLHQEFYKKDVAGFFGLEYKEGLWKMPGHVCPKESEDQFLFVTLNKKNHDPNYRYHDYFIDSTHFHWQSQNNTSTENEKGRGIIESKSRKGSIYLFVRKFPKIKGKGAPFLFCGKLEYLKHSGSKPINVEFQLENRLPKSLYDYFKS